MLKLYDKNHNFIGRILKYSGCKKESEAATGDITLSFTYLAGTFDIQNEYYVQTRDAEYVVKEVSGSRTEGQEVVAVLNLEALEQNVFLEFSVTDATITEAARFFLAGTGWTVGECTVTKRRSAGMRQVDARQGILKLCTAFMCEPVFDTKTKTVSFYEETGEDKGVYFLKGLNLRKLSKTQTSYDFYTRLIPIGADGLTIEGVNGGVNYLENHQYSDKVRTTIWQDDSYTDAQALKEDAIKKLDDLSKPVAEYSADIIDLAAQKPEYGILSYHLGDTVTLIDQDTGTREKQRIRKITEYEQEPEKNTCELGNTVLTFEELQDKLQAAAEIVGYTMTSDGKIHVSDILKWEEGVAGSQAVQGLNSSVTSLNGQLGALSLLVGTINANYLSVDQADLKYADIERLNAAEATVHSIQGDYAEFKSTVTDELSAQTALIDEVLAKTVTTDYLEANYAQVDLANIKDGCITTAMIGQGVVDTAQIADGSITDAKIVELTANKITAGILSVERLEIRGSTNSIVYALNSITGALQAQNVDTLNGEILTQRTITADKIVANAITANEIAAKTITANSGIIADAAITTAAIADAAVTNAKIANLDAGKITTGTLDAGRIGAKSIKAEKIDVDDLFAQNITATGTINGAHLVGSTITVSSDVYGELKIEYGRILYEHKGFTATEVDGNKYIYDSSFSIEGSVFRYSGVKTGGNGVDLSLMLNPHVGLEVTANKSVFFATLPRESAINATNIKEGGVLLKDKYAAKSHGNHIPAIQAADNATFLRNDNTWQKVTPANIGAAAANHGTHVSGIKDLTAVTYNDWSVNSNFVPTVRFLAYWNGANGPNGGSNLAYCNRGAFGTIVTHNAGDYAAASHSHSYLPLSGGYVSGHTGIGYENTGYGLSVSTFICNDWLRTNGNTGWYNQSYGGGWYMIDTTWLRAYNGKSIYTPGVVRADGGFEGKVNQVSALTCGTPSNSSYAGGPVYIQAANAGAGDRAQINFHNPGAVGACLYLDNDNRFKYRHANTSVTDTLSIDGQIVDSSGTTRKPVGTSGTYGQYVNAVYCSASAVAFYGQWGGGSFSGRSLAISASDIRLKANIAPTTVEALPAIRKMQMRAFDWTDHAEHQELGFVADELELIDRKLAIGGGYTEDGGLDVKSVNTFYLMGYVVKGMQELDGAVRGTDARYAGLEAQIAALQAELSEARMRIAALEQIAA